MIKIGNTEIKKAYLGSTELSQIYIGNVPLLSTKTVIEQLQDLGCLMWFPMNSNGFNDVVGSRAYSATSSFTTKGTYCQCIFTNNNIATIDITSLTSSDFVDGGFTTFLQAQRHGTASFRGSALCHLVNNVGIAGAYDNVNNTADTSQWTTNTWYEGVIVRNQDGTRKIYSQQTLIVDDTYTYPDIWDYNTIAVKAANNKRLYVRNFLLFGKALSAAEISQVHQLIS